MSFRILSLLCSLALASTAAAQAPTAQFGGAPTTGVAPHTVFFTDLSTGSITSWAWDFGDGSTSTLEDPTKVFSAAGSYTVSLTVTGPGGSDSEVKVAYVTVTPPAPVANFTGTPLTGAAPLTVSFTNTSTGSFTSRLWDFGDGTTSAVNNPSKTYTVPGTYTVNLTVNGPGGTDTETKVGYVVVSHPPPVSDFVGTPLSGPPPLTVYFTSLATGTITSGTWNFGDGGTSTVQNPSKTYASPGTYTVSFTVSGPGGTDVETKTAYVTVGQPPPVAAFSGTPLTGLAPHTVTFTDQSTGGPRTSWLWNFGDGTTSTSQNPSKSYAAPGSYSVSLTVTGPGGTDAEVKSDYVTVNYPPPVAQFFGSPLTGVAPHTVNFTNLSTGTITGYTWTFGDGTNSSSTTPTKTYTVPGTYAVTLTAIGPGGTDLETKSAYVTVLEPAPVAAFTGVPRVGVAPLSVSFTNYSQGNLTSRSWDFGDGNTSTVTNPTHTYTVAGSYTVTLTVTSAGGSDTETKLNYIVVSQPPPVADFTGSPLTGPPGLTTNFTDTSTGSVNSWLWDFGDGSTSTLQNPSHSFANPGAYSITLTVNAPGGLDSERKVGYVVVGQPPPVADFVASVTNGVRPLAVDFTDLTGGPTTSWLWNFGDGGTSASQNPSYTYTAAGTYTVTLTSTGPGGSDTETKVGYIVVAEQPPVAQFGASPTTGIKPLLVNFTDASTGGPVTSRLWNFGDGTTSTATNPSKNYTLAGVYTVSLTVTGPGGTDTETKTSFITVNEPAPVAQFSGTPLNGVAPLTVVFTNLTTGGPVTTYTWSFGDGTFSSDLNPTKVYNTPGVYNVILNAAGPGGSDNEIKVNYITVNTPPPTAEFTASAVEGVAPFSVDFSDISTGSPTSWSWSFGDGGTATTQNPTHVYTTPGVYTVSLTVVGPSGADTETKSGLITVKPVVADFIGFPTSGNAPLLVSFTDLSQGAVTSWLWNFGDGATATAQNVAHSYTTYGKFTVTLTATGPSGTDTETKVQYIEVGKGTVAQENPPSGPLVDADPNADFLGVPRIGPAPLTVSFFDASIGQWGSRSWNFGDGGTATGSSPVHTYVTPGTYTVSLTATRAFGAITDTETKVGYITVTLPVIFEDPSFEDTSSLPLPSASWSMSGTGAIVLARGNDGDSAMPTHGEQWLSVSTEGTFDARPASNPLGEGDLPVGAAGVAQKLHFDPSRPMLAFEAAFVLGEKPGSAANDFFSIDLSDGVKSVNLYHADTFSKLSRARRADGLFRTEVSEVRRDLAELFPEAVAGTELTLWIQAGNGGDDRNDSFGYADNFRMGPVAKVTRLGATHPQCLTAVAPVSGRAWLAEVDSSAFPGAQFTVVVGHERAQANVLATSGALLDLASPQVFFSMLPASGGIDTHELDIPRDPALIGRSLYAQGMVVGPTGRHYCNALELLLGF